MEKIFCIAICCSLLIPALGFGQVHHGLDVKLVPQDNSITVSDTIFLNSNYQKDEIHFLLHAGLTITETYGPAELKETKIQPAAGNFRIADPNWSAPEDVPLRHYILKLNPVEQPKKSLIVRYSGKINQEIKQLAQEYARGFSETPGIISTEGVYLAGSSYWVPWFDEELITFNLNITLDHNWDAVSQGQEMARVPGMVRWVCNSPTEEIYLIAGPFTRYSKQAGAVAVLAYLRTPDEALAQKYLETTGQYLEMYRGLIGPYPYSKFALVENFWETGYGMPSFTLLGSKVIRFPFILHSSYPHELLHNWWGNGVYVNYTTGNWCEGLTAYLADHLIKEQRGQGGEYRRTALQAYTDYVNETNEFPLAEFRSRTDAASSAIGYNKSLMIFHMIRRQIGDDLFTRFLQNFYMKNKFKRAGFEQIRQSIEAVTGQDWTEFFDKLINISGAPQLKLEDASIRKEPNGYSLSFSLIQSQKKQIYNLQIPVAVVLENEPEIEMQTVNLNQSAQKFTLSFNKQPVQVYVDPEFDIFRTLDRNEIPPSLSHIFGTQNVMMIVPADESKDLHDAYLNLAETWASDKTRLFKIAQDDTLFEIPLGYSVWLFGRKNKFSDIVIEKMSEYNAGFDGSGFRFGDTELALKGNSVITVVRNPQDPSETVVWLQTDVPEAVPGLGRKLPHYGKYSYLAFEGTEPTNTIKGQWAAINSPLFINLSKDGLETEPVFPDRPALADLAPLFSEENLRDHVVYLADEKLEGRGFGSKGLWQASEYIAAKFKEIGLQPGGDDGTYFQQWQDSRNPDEKPVTLRNVIGIIPGMNSDWQSQSVVICAHYDHLGLGWPDVREGNEGKIHPGADDNASGVAILIEMARAFAQREPGRTIIFAAFTAEEAGLRGSKYYVRHRDKYPVDQIIGVLNLDTVGRLFNNKLLILGGNSADEWKHIAMGVGFVTGIPYELVNQDLDASDQVSFLAADVPGVQFFSGAHTDYHRPGDNAEHLDYQGMVKVAAFVRETLAYLADERDKPLTFTDRKSGSTAAITESTAAKRAATGIMPDFVFSGPGVKVGAVGEGSAAAQGGIKPGDIILAVDGKDIEDLQGYASILRQYQPGNTVTLKYGRDNQIFETEITLGSR